MTSRSRSRRALSSTVMILFSSSSLAPARCSRLGPLEVQQIGGHLLPLAALDAVERDAIALDIVFADDVESAVFQVELEVRRKQGSCRKKEQSEDAPHAFIVVSAPARSERRPSAH